VLDIQQDLDQQARPVDIRIGPHTTSRDGRFLFEVSPSFAVPGPASMQLQVTANGVTETVSGGISAGHPASGHHAFRRRSAS
jgi:hypothetical protein